MRSAQFNFASTMKSMERPISDSASKGYVVLNTTKPDNTSGMTISTETPDDKSAMQAEYEVLRSILCRENYLERLHQVARTIGKKFKSDIADILDMVRAATLDVIDNILKWRKVKVSSFFLSIIFYPLT